MTVRDRLNSGVHLNPGVTAAKSFRILIELWGYPRVKVAAVYRCFLKCDGVLVNADKSLPLRVQSIEGALQLLKLLPCLAELAFRCQSLVVGKVFGCFRD